MSDPVKVEMNSIEVIWATTLAAIKRTSAWRNGYNSDKHTDKRSDWAWDVEGVLAEMAFAKWLNVYYTPKNLDGKRPDVAGNQVRSTAYAQGHMYFRPNDKENAHQRFVLAVTHRNAVFLIGWLMGVECMKDEFWEEADDAWCVTQGALHDMASFGAEFPK